MGFFRPDMGEQAMAALEMMDFEGKEMVKKSVSQNLQLQQQLAQMQQQLTQLAGAVVASQKASQPEQETPPSSPAEEQEAAS